VDIKASRKLLLEIYAEFEKAAEPYVGSAVCKPGCADCCTMVGNVDVTTLEGMLILGHLQGLPSSRQKMFAKRLKENARLKTSSKYARCAFLSENNTCSIYELRPFSCRRVYSMKECGAQGPVVHRQVWEFGEQAIAAIQKLDDTGYSGHLSFIIQLLKDAGFRKTYIGGGFHPDAIREFAGKHKIVINRFALPPGHDRVDSPPIQPGDHLY
jgi:Fe-S-cluster containining protein